MKTGSIQAQTIILTPIAPEDAPNDAIYNSTVDNSMGFKNAGGTPIPITAATAETLFQKQMQIAGPIANKAPVAKKADGRIVQADSDGVGTQDYIGVAMEEGVNENDKIQVFLIGANIAGLLTGLGFTPGDRAYLSEGGGYTNDIHSFTGSNDSIIKLGVADCAAGDASGTATDLISVPEIIATP